MTPTRPEVVAALIARLTQRGNELHAAAAWGFDGDGYLMHRSAELLRERLTVWQRLRGKLRRLSRAK